MITAVLSNLKFIIIGILVILAIVIALRYPSLRTAVAILSCVIFVFCSGLAINRVVNYYTVSGKTYGDIGSVFNNNQVDFEKTDEYTFEFKNFGLQSTTITNQYQARATDTHKIDIDLSNRDWALYVNGALLSNINSTNTTLSGELTYVFNDTNHTPIKLDTLTISLSFENKQTEIVLTTNGGDIAVNLWNNYLNKNGFKLELKKVEPRIPNNKVINYNEEPTEAPILENSYTQKASDKLEFDFYINKKLFDTYNFKKQVDMAFYTPGINILTFKLQYIDNSNDYYHFYVNGFPKLCKSFSFNFCLIAQQNYSNNDKFALFMFFEGKNQDTVHYTVYLNSVTRFKDANTYVTAAY